MNLTTWAIDKIDRKGIIRIDERLAYYLALKEKKKQEEIHNNLPGWQTFVIMRIEN